MRTVSKEEFERRPLKQMGSEVLWDDLTKDKILLNNGVPALNTGGARMTHFDFTASLATGFMPDRATLINQRVGAAQMFNEVQLGLLDAVCITGIPGVCYVSFLDIPKSWPVDFKETLYFLWDPVDIDNLSMLVIDYIDQHIKAQSPKEVQSASLFQWWGHSNEYLSVAMTEEEARAQIDQSVTASIAENYREEWAKLRDSAADRVIKFGDSWINPRYQ